MQQSTVWWTRRDHKGPTKYGGGTNWFETYQSRGINNEEERGYEPRVDKLIQHANMLQHALSITLDDESSILPPGDKQYTIQS